MPSFSFNRRVSLKIATAMAIPKALLLADAANASSPEWIQGIDDSEAAVVNDLVRTFMQQYSVPGLSLAMTYRGKLKLLVCAGYADTTSQTAVAPDHRFRIASVSKPITSITTMLMAQSGRLQLDQPVFTTLLPEFSSEISRLGSSNQRRLQSMTLRHLLEHTAGGWGNRTADPMFTASALGMSHHDLIRWTLNNRALAHDPGQHYAYSNFGYCLVGRVLEKRMNMSYENVVRKYVLEPSGLQDQTLKIGGNTFAERQTNEVTYYGQSEEAYHRIMDVKRMDAHGGWVGSPTDLVRLLTGIDNQAKPSGLLQPKWIKIMTTASHANPGYAKGWSVNKQGSWWHTGSFNGGSAILARINDGHSWAMTMNTRSKKKGYSSALDRLPWDIKRSIKTWGSHDLF
ncbi:MAG: serine hydrolase domain-containing protein [Fuerstiella sp.]